MKKTKKVKYLSIQPISLNNHRFIKTISIILSVYLFIAMLHGIAPGIWGKSFNGEEGKGPFRILMFTPLILIALFLCIALNQNWAKNNFLKPKICYLKVVHKPYSHRGPPSY
ncbi:MAG TPA: hypothetical protein PLX23_06645 [Candidatus Hydrogenedens sp.]|nr:hypothetical protein [Candidatus Hydrogenedens sp.]